MFTIENVNSEEKSRMTDESFTGEMWAGIERENERLEEHVANQHFKNDFQQRVSRSTTIAHNNNQSYLQYFLIFVNCQLKYHLLGNRDWGKWSWTAKVCMIQILLLCNWPVDDWQVWFLICRWLVYSDPGFQGLLAVLETGEYPFPEDWGFQSPIVGSLRPLRMVCVTLALFTNLQSSWCLSTHMCFFHRAFRK